jgi:hypothetical protein
MNELLASPHFGEHLAIGWLDAAVIVHGGGAWYGKRLRVKSVAAVP